MRNSERLRCLAMRLGSVQERWYGDGTRTAGLGVARALVCLLCAALAFESPSALARAQSEISSTSSAAVQLQPVRPPHPPDPSRVTQARRFLARRGWSPERDWGPGAKPLGRHGGLPGSVAGSLGRAAAPRGQPGASPTWKPVGPDSELTVSYGAVSGRVTALALDPSDSTGNHLFVGTTGGGVWSASNAAVGNPALVVFNPLTDAVPGMSTAMDASISIGALTVQPGGTGVVLAGTGDPNDALDSYYGAGILRSADGGNSWSLIPSTGDSVYSFAGNGFAGFAWSTDDPQTVVAAVSQAYEGTLVNVLGANASPQGLYYSTNAGGPGSGGQSSWSMSTIEDSPTEIIQGPGFISALASGNPATSVVWNPVRHLFIAAVRYHGYYQSSDGITFTRMSAQPGTGFSALYCPTNPESTGSIDCPIFRGTVAVNPLTGDTFAWSVDSVNQDQGLWQDACAITLGGACGNQNITFAQQWNTAALESDTGQGAATIANGDYNLALAAAPYALQQGADTWLLAGANDLWRCSLAQGCVWRNTTNATTCMSAQVGEFQHAIEWSTNNPLEIFVGNDSGLWRSLDVIGETGVVCNATDATHFQNLNGGLGSLAEVESLATSSSAQYVMMAGLGFNGTAGLKSATAAEAQWPQILGGNGGPVAIDPLNSENWYVNNQYGVAIYLCSDPSNCTPSGFGNSPVLNDADVGGDGYVMDSPAPFLVDPLDPSQLLIGTCRMWRGPANGVGWTGSNAVSPILDSNSIGTACSGDSLIRSMAALPVSGGKEVVYAGLYGTASGGQSLPGHVFSATIDPASASMPSWTDLTLNPVTAPANSPSLNQYGYDISSIFIDPHDPTGNTVYVTVEAFQSTAQRVQTVYGSIDGGAHWASYMANLPSAPVSAVVVDPQSASTLYLATDAGVYFTTQAANCASEASTCWTAFGTGLPGAPVVALSAAPAAASAQVLTAATYGRGIWQTPLWTAGTNLTTATATPVSLTFASQVSGTPSATQPVTLTNTGTIALLPTAVVASGDFSETDNCVGTSIPAAGTCTIQVTFTPTATGSRTGTLTIGANVYAGQLAVALAGTGTAAGVLSVTPPSIPFDAAPGQTSSLPTVALGTTSGLFPVSVNNSGTSAIPVSAISVTPPFAIASNSCGTTSFAAVTSCQIQLTFTPTQEGAIAGTLSLVDGAGTQTVLLSGFGYAPPTDQLNPTSVAFPNTAVGQVSAALPVLLTNTGDLPLTSIEATVSAGFQTSNTCGTQLAAHSACTVTVSFAPTQLGAQTGSLTVKDLVRVQTVPLTGTAVQPATLAASPASITFPTQSFGAASTPIVLTVTNTGGVAAANVGFQITGPAAASFSTGTTTCTATLAAGTSCTVQVIFNPLVAGGSQASLVISSATPGVTPVTVPLNGAAQIAAGLNVSPAQLSFGSVMVGSPSTAQTVTVSNTSSSAATALTLVQTLGFTLTQNTCTATLAAAASCTVGVVFTPQATGAASGSLNVTSAAIANSAIVNLSGTGVVASAIQVTPAILQFATTGVGQSSSPATVTVTNSGAVSALASLSLAVPAGFAIKNNTCASTLAPAASCTAQVVFTPTAAGPATGSLMVSSSSVATASAVPLSGMGFDFTVTFSGSSAQSVAAGLTATYTVVITPLNGSAGAFTLACNPLPTNALCVFNPATETLTAGVTGNVLVQVTTGGSTGSTTAALRRAGVGGLLACGLLLLPFGRRRGRRVLRRVLLLGVASILVGGMVSCTSSGGGTGGGGSGGGGGTSGLTAAGTYSIPVTVTSTSTNLSRTVTVTLTVD